LELGQGANNSTFKTSLLSNVTQDNFRMDLRKTAWDVVSGIHLAQDKDHRQALMNMIKKFWV
jgi:hypothetical protein